jgi:CHAD domain-containing protein
MGEGKWIEGLSPETRVVEAARRTLEVRFGVIEHHLAAALEDTPRDPEHVHQLRVGTRRAVAALDIFCGCFKKKHYRKPRKRLAHLRRAAGRARDWDVFRIALVGPLADGKPFDFLLGYARGQRDAAERDLHAAGAEFPHGFDGFTRKVLDRLDADQNDKRPLRKLAAPLLGELLNELQEAARGNLHDYEHLHAVRVLGKRLRYAMEVFVSCYAEAFRTEFYPEVEAMQEILGQANDSHMAATCLKALRLRMRAADPKDWSRVRAEVEAWLRHHERRLPEQRKQFVAWWKRWQKCKPQEWLRTLEVE